ncbi:MAG: PepSY domain-containing protein [Propionivibrio sp.]
MNKMIAMLSATLAATLFAGAAIAGPSCSVPQDKWMKEADFKSHIESQGYQIKTFKVSKGKCYEIYGFDKAGKKVEIYFDPQTAAVLEAK